MILGFQIFFVQILDMLFHHNWYKYMYLHANVTNYMYVHVQCNELYIDMYNVM